MLPDWALMEQESGARYAALRVGLPSSTTASYSRAVGVTSLGRRSALSEVSGEDHRLSSKQPVAGSSTAGRARSQAYD